MLTVREIMTPSVITLSSETTLRDAVALFARHHVSGAPVAVGTRVVGIVSMTDILDFQASTPPVPALRDAEVEPDATLDAPLDLDDEDEPASVYFADLWADAGAELGTRFESAESPEWDLLAEHTVEEVMTAAPLAVPPGTRVDAAADMMRRHGIHRLLVTSGDRLLGVVTTTDIARAVANHELVVHRYVFDRR